MATRTGTSPTSTTRPTTTPSQGTPSTGAGTGMQVPHDKIAARAYERWVKRGRPHGTDKQDWLEAEAELRAEMGRTGSSQPRR
jgi:hypothetical protein